MHLKILVFFFSLLISNLASSEELRFSNEVPWLLGFGREWKVSYFCDPLVSPDVHEAPVTFTNSRFYCDFADGPIVSAMLYHKGLYVCNLKKDKEGKWYVPKLSNVTFDLHSFEGLKPGVYVSFFPRDLASGFVEEVKAGRKTERLIDRGLTVYVFLVNPLDMEDLENIGVFMVADANYGVVTLEGNPHDKWSMKVSWSPSGSVHEAEKSEQRGAGQPDTKPADKVPSKDHPSTQPSKDGAR